MKRIVHLLAMLMLITPLAVSQDKPMGQTSGEKHELDAAIARKLAKAAVFFGSNESEEQLQPPLPEKLKRKLQESRQQRDLSEQVKSRKSDVLLTEPNPHIFSIPEKYDSAAAHRFIELTAANNDLVVIGKIRFQLSSLTATKDSVFTLSFMDVEQIIKPHNDLREGGRINVLRRGGATRVGGKKVVVNVENFAHFQSGHEYLLFLKYNAELGSYIASAPNSFEMLPHEVKPLAGRQYHPARSLLQNPDEFVTAVRSISPHAR
jgi:hypothetical protein